MTDRKKILLDLHVRRMQEVFTPEDLARLNAMVQVLWARDEPMPAEALAAAKADVFAIITPGWRHGPVSEWPQLRAILDVGGRLPSPETLDYQTCFSRGIRVLTCAPAFGPTVAEMTLGMVLAATRDNPIYIGHAKAAF